MSEKHKEVWCESLRFLNAMLVRSPNEKKRAQLMARLNVLGLTVMLKNMVRVKDPGIIKQLQNLQMNTRQVFPTMQYEVEIHRKKVKQLELHN